MKKLNYYIMACGAAVLAGSNVCYATCPTGYTQRILPAALAPGSAKNSHGVCTPLCSGIGTQLRTGNGFQFNLFASKTTDIAMGFGLNGVACYGDLILGQTNSGINVRFNDTIYHLYDNIDFDCPVPFTLSYSCGDGATGTPPDSVTVNWGDNYSVAPSAGGCSRPGYYFAGWKIDGAARTADIFYNWQYTTNKTAVASWAVDSYIAIYSCNYCDKVFGLTAPYETVSYGSTYSPKSPNTSGGPSCTNAYNQQFLGYRLLDAWGNDTGTVINPGASLTWNYSSGMKLRPIWDAGDEVPVASEPVYYTLTYSCGADSESGTVSGTDTIAYRDLYSVTPDYGTCRRMGYIPSGWKIGTATRSPYTFYQWTYTANQSATVNWVRNTFVAIYECNTGAPSSVTYKTVTWGNSFTPAAPGAMDGETMVGPNCTTPAGMEFAGYDVLDAWGNALTDSNAFIAPGASLNWDYEQSLKFRAKWQPVSE